MALEKAVAFAAIVFAGTALANPAMEVRVSRSATSEQHERNVDEVALSAQEKAISRLQSLLRKYRNTRQEPVLLSKLADVQQQAASILFRLSLGGKAARGAAGKARFQKAMKQAIASYSTLIAKYPHYEEIAHAYFARGKGYEELDQKAQATKDYLHLVKNFPTAEEAPSAYMSLAEFSIQENNHARAITYLNEVEKLTEHPLYPFALYKLAWSHYNLKNIPAALSFAERQVAYYNGRNSPADGTATSDEALRENTLLDLAVFYFEGYEQKRGEYSLSNAYPYFRKIEAGPVLGRMLHRFSKLLRSHDHEEDLMAFKDELLRKEPGRAETLEVLLTTYEYQLNKRRYQQLIQSSQDLVTLHALLPEDRKSPEAEKRHATFARAQKLVLDTAEGLQAMIVKNKAADDVRSYSVILASIYEAFTKIVDETDPRIPRVHYNLAETLFAIKDFNGATTHYRWVVDHGDWDAKTKDGQATVPDASLKAIASRYEVLREKKLIPTELAARSPAKARDTELDPALAEWVQWIDRHVKLSGRASESADNFVFEANRALYAQNHLPDALARMGAFVKRRPGSTFASPTASLMLDTYIAGQDWERTHDLAEELMKYKPLNTGAFQKKLLAVAADASYKLIEASHARQDADATMDGADDFLEKYPASDRLSDVLALAGAAGLRANQKARADIYFSRLIKEASNPGKSISTSNLGAALIARAQMAEELYRFPAAATDYRAYLALPAKALKLEESKADELRKKTLTLIWLGGEDSALSAALSDKTLCSEGLAQECDKFSALSALSAFARLSDNQKEETTRSAFERCRKSSDSTSKESRAIWAAVALEGSRELAFRDRNVALRNLSDNWDELDPLVRTHLLPFVTASIPRALEQNRIAMKDVAPLRADERYITRRVEVIRELENATTKIVKLPWARIRAESLNEIAETYLDFARSLMGLKPPKGLNEEELAAYQDTVKKLVFPFEEKGQEMRSKSFELASKFAIEDEPFRKISEPFFAENPSQAKRLRLPAAVSAPPALDLAYLASLDPDGNWQELARLAESDSPKLKSAEARVKAYWARALKSRRWRQVAFFLQEAREKSLIPPGTLGIVRSVSLAALGARAEGLTELEDARKNLPPEARIAASTVLMQHYLKAFAREKTRTLFKEVESEQASRNEKPSQEQASLNALATTAVQ
ncbi:MAG: hypothetical protein NDJ89_10615 [Oligoflexia bacterium]|nr:hypothetical protein [Oligoflexia bacterium]